MGFFDYTVRSNQQVFIGGNESTAKGLIWEIAARSNKKPKVVRRRKTTTNTAYFTGC